MRTKRGQRRRVGCWGVVVRLGPPKTLGRLTTNRSESPAWQSRGLLTGFGRRRPNPGSSPGQALALPLEKVKMRGPYARRR